MLASKFRISARAARSFHGSKAARAVFDSATAIESRRGTKPSRSECRPAGRIRLERSATRFALSLRSRSSVARHPSRPPSPSAHDPPSMRANELGRRQRGDRYSTRGDGPLDPATTGGSRTEVGQKVAIFWSWASTRRHDFDVAHVCGPDHYSGGSVRAWVRARRCGPLSGLSRPRRSTPGRPVAGVRWMRDSACRSRWAD